MKKPKEEDSPARKMVEKLYGKRRTRGGYGDYDAKQYCHAFAALKKKELKQAKKLKPEKKRRSIL